MYISLRHNPDLRHRKTAVIVADVRAGMRAPCSLPEERDEHSPVINENLDEQLSAQYVKLV